MVGNGAFDFFESSLDPDHPAQAWLAFHEGGIIGGSSELAACKIRAAGLRVRVVLHTCPPSAENDIDRVTLLVTSAGTVQTATAG